MTRQSLPAGMVAYRTVGPWNAGEIPMGLLQEHRLKSGTWGELNILSGSVRFLWDDGSERVDLLSTGGSMVIPPEAPHHLELVNDVRLSITFWRSEA